MHTFLLFLRKYTGLFLLIGMMMNGGDVVGQNYNQITSLVELVDGSYLIVGDGSANDGLMSNTISGTPFIEFSAVTNPGSTINSGFTSNNVFTISVTGSQITIFNASVGYATWGRTGNTGNTASFFNGTAADSERWSVSVASGLWTLSNVATPSRLLQWNNSSPRFAAYTSAQVKLKLYKLDAPTGIISQTSGNWNDPNTWAGGAVPTSTQDAIIDEGDIVTLDTTTDGNNVRNAGTTTVVKVGGTLAVGNVTYTNNGSTTINGTFQINNGGFSGGNNDFVYGTAGNLIFNHGTPGTDYVINEGHKYWPSATLSSPKNITVNSNSPIELNLIRNVAGTFATASRIKISAGNSLTLNGTCQINAGGFFNNAPIYGGSSTLIYNNGGTFGRTAEFLNVGIEPLTIGTTPGYPNNVIIQNNTTFNYLNGASGTAGNKAIHGNLTIESGSSFYMNDNLPVIASGGFLHVKGNVENKGIFKLGNANNDDLNLGGNFINTGTFNGNNRAIFFTKNGTQTVSSTTALTIPYVVFEPSSGSTTVQLLNDVSVSAALGGNAISFSASASDVFDINGRTLTIGTPLVGNSISGVGTFKGSTTSNLTLRGTGSIGILRFESAGRVLRQLILDRSDNEVAAELGTNLTIDLTLSLTNGIFDTKASTLTIGALANIATARNTSFIVADVAAGGRLRKNFPATGSFTFPIGNSATQYSPGTINISAGNFNADPFVSLNVAGSKEPNNFSPTHFINRFWNLTGNGISTATYSFTGTFLPSDIPVGANIANMKSGRWRASNDTWIQSPSNLSSNIVSLSGLTTTTDGAFNGTNAYNFTAGDLFKLTEINIRQNFTSIPSGNQYNFGDRALGTSTEIEFNIQNLGTEILNLGAATLSGSPNYSLSQNYAATVDANGVTTFRITFTPTTIGLISGSISIPNNDLTGGENPYVINFTGNGTFSNTSDIVTAGGEPETISSLVNTTTINSVTDGVEVWRFTIRDGGASLNDVDNAPTIVNSITLGQSSGNALNDWADAIQSVALFHGSTKVATGDVTANQILFNFTVPLNVPDNDIVMLAMRLSLKPTLSTILGNFDNDDFHFSITNANAIAATTGSQFSNFNAAISVNDKNKYDVIATHLSFVQQPSTTGITTAMTPAVTVQATDINGNRDLDYTTSVSITSTGTLAGTPVNANTVVAGLATFSTLTHTVAGIGFTLTASSTGLTGATSSAFDITTIVYMNGDYRSATSGLWNPDVTQTAAYAKWDIRNSNTSGGWDLNVAPPARNTSNNVYISDGTVVTTGNSYGNNIRIKILSGGRFVHQHNSTAHTVYIYDGGIFEFGNQPLRINTLFEIENGGTFLYNYVANPGQALTLWNGQEIFHPNSNFVIQNHDTGGTNYFIPPPGTTLGSAQIAPNTFNGVTAYFGNLIVESSSNEIKMTETNLNNATITHGNLELKPNANFSFLYGTGALTWTIGKDLIIGTNAGSPSTARTLTVTTATKNVTFNVKGNFINNSTNTFRLRNVSSGSNPTVIMNVDGNIDINSGTLDLNFTSTGSGTVNLKGDLFVANGAQILANNATTAIFNFNGTGDGVTDATTQTINVVNQATASNIAFNVKNGAYAKLINQNFAPGTGSKLTVENGGTLDFGFNGTTPLNVTGSSFEAISGSTLKITSPNGITTAGNTGNVQTTTRIFGTVAPFGNYQYIGKANQSTGNALPATVNNLTVNNETLTNDLTLSQAVKVQGTLAMLSGNIVSTSTNLLEIGTSAVAKGSLSYTNGFVKGPMKRWFNGVNSGIASGLFPLGTSDNKNRFAQIEYTTAPTAGALTAQLQGTMGVAGLIPPPEIPAVGSCPIFNVLSTDNMYWGMTASDNLANGVYTATITKEDASATDAICKQTILTGTGLTWGVLGSHEAPTGTPTNITLKRTGISAIRNLGMGKGYCGTITKIYDEVSDWTTTPPTILDRIEVTANYTIPANALVSACDCKVSNNVTLTVAGNATMALVEGLTVEAGSLLDIKDSGSLVQYRNVDNAAGNNNIGNIKMERKTKPVFRFDYTYWSSPVQGFILKNVSPTTLFDKFFRWNETTQAWFMHSGNAVPLHVMEEGRGYIVRAPQGFPIETSTATALVHTANFTGVPNNGTVQVPIFGSTSPVVADNKWNLLGNPYPSALDATIFLNQNPNLGGTLYFWTHNTSISGASPSYSPNDYASWNGTGYAAILEFADGDEDEINDNAPSGDIAAGQGFFVKGIGNGAGTATFNNTMRIAGENNQFFKAAEDEYTTNSTPQEKYRVWLNMKGTPKGFNQLLVGYVTNATNDYDNRYDGESFGGNLVTFYSINNTKNLVIQGRALPFFNTDTVPLGYKTTLTGNLTISIDHVDGGMVGQDIYLQDNVLNVVHDLTASNYVFATVPGTFNNRFVLRYLPQENLSNPTFDDKLKSVTIYKNKATLHVHSPYESIASVMVYDLTGRLIFERKDCNTNRFETSELLSVDQALIVKVTLVNGAVVSEKVL